MPSGFDLTRTGTALRFQAQHTDYGDLTQRVIHPERFAETVPSGAGIPLIWDNAPTMLNSFSTPAPTGGLNPYLGALIGLGRDITTAIINRGNQQQTQQIPNMTGGTLPLPGTIPAPPGGVISQTGPGIPPQLYYPHDVQLSAQAPAGGWPTTKDGRPRRVRRDGRPWKRPSMNPTNPRALGRAMRRVNSFASIAKRTITFTKRVKMKSRKRT